MSSVVCPHCRKSVIREIYCRNCSGILPISDVVDLFTLLGFSVDFDLNKAVINKAAVQLLSYYHPDKFAVATNLSRKIATENSAKINSAVQVLSDDTKRAEYMLFLAGIDLEVYEKKLPASLLTFFFKFQEELESSDTVEEYKKLDLYIKEERLTNYNDLKYAFAAQDLVQSAFLCIKRNFLNKIKRDIQNKLYSYL